MDNPSRRRTLEFPKPETGLAEWTSKIKELQREVDADEEAEQRRLEEEIRASRLARSRRSIGLQHTSTDPSSTVSAYARARRDSTPGETGRETTPADALRKLTDGDRDPAPNRVVHAPTQPVVHARSVPLPTPGPSKPEAMSLAAFMGGRATGPRLNRHAPQQDAQDPTQFEQRMASANTAPHPVFGRGGIAMPGLAGKGRVTSVIAREEPAREVRETAPARSWSRERTKSTPARSDVLLNSASEMPRYGRPSEQPSGRAQPVLSTSFSPPDRPKSSSSNSPVKQESFRRSSPYDEPSRQYTPSPVSSSSASRSPHTPQLPRSTSSTSPITTPSLARPVQPQLRATPTGPQLPPSQNPSPAFLRPPPQKDPTPSLSRLQGRGFVQSLVKMSSELQAAATGSASPGATKKASVLDRWQPAAAQQVPAPTSPGPMTRKARAVDASPVQVPIPTGASAHSDRRRSLKSVSSLPQLSSTPSPPSSKSRSVIDDAPSPGLPRLGSSNTMISYIRPTKTGEEPPTQVQTRTGTSPSRPPSRGPPSRPASRGATSEHGDVDELGMRSGNFGSDFEALKRARTKAEASTGRPLSHPTKDRARRPRKGAHSGAQLENATPDSPVLPLEVIRRGSSKPGPSHAATPVPTEKKPESAPQALELTLSPTAPTPAREQYASEAPPSPNQTRVSNVQRLKHSWADQPPIGVKPLRKPPPNVDSYASQPPSSGGPAHVLTKHAHALPGLTSPPLTPPLTVREEVKPPVSPTRHHRIPSSGSRPTVMDVAQAMGVEHFRQSSAQESAAVPQTRVHPASDDDEDDDGNDEGGNGTTKHTQGGDWGTRTITPALVQAERRRSSYEKYSAFAMPPLKEEKTPVPSPVGTLTRGGVAIPLPIAANVNTTPAVQQAAQTLQNVASDAAIPAPTHLPPTKKHVDEPLPSFDIQQLWSQKSVAYAPNPDVRTVSVEVLNIVGNVATAVVDNANIFHDAETLAIVHRGKSKSSGLASTTLWGWRGRKSKGGDKETQKLRDLARRFNTSLEMCEQYAEPQELLHVLGGTFAVRQASRSIWSGDNTTMHIVRTWRDLTLIDEIDLNVRSLCSGYSYCITVLDTLWVWYGRGSTDLERRGALAYSQTLMNGNKIVVEVEEGGEDDVFWMFLGDEGYANADHWKWKKDHGESITDPRLWRIDAKDQQPIRELAAFADQRSPLDSIFVINLACEIFVLVGTNARTRRTEIRLALELAKELALYTADARPFLPPVHVVVLPSRLPLDLRVAVRGLDEDLLNNVDVPPHMNILTLDEALDHLQTNEWDGGAIEDKRMLPLGVGP